MAEQDITQTGPVGLRGLRGLNRTNSNPVLDDYDLFKSNYNMPSTKSDWLNGENSPYGYTSALEDHTEQAFNVGFGDYNVDRKIGRAEQLNNIYNTRGELQSTASQLLNALGQGITTMGTTFLNGTVGLVVGAITATDRGDLSGMWDNDFARSMDSINKWSEEAMPMHMTDRERESVWNQGIGNFVGNLILKPAGFVAGAALSGGAWSKLATGAVKGLSAAIGAGKQVNSGTQFLNNLNNAKNLVKTGNITSKAVGAITSTAGEAAIEALNNSNEKYEANKQSIDQYYGSLVDTQLQDIYQKMPDIDPKLALELAVNEADAKFNYNEALSKLEEDRISTGNLDYMLNFPILMASNIWQFGKFYSRGFNANKRAFNLIKKGADGKYVANTIGAGKKALKLGSNILTEGQEEMLQGVAAETANQRYGSEFNSFYGARIIPDAEQETQSLLSSFLKATGEVYSDKERYFEMLSGSLMGGVGNIRFEKKGVTSSGKLSHGIYFEDIREANDTNTRTNLLIDQMNERVESPAFRENYQGMIRHRALENVKKQALNKDDQYTYENAEHSQMISDIIMFDKADKLNDLNDLIDEISSISPDDVAKLREDTVNDSGTSPFDGMTDQEVIDNFKNRAADIKSTISNYAQISRDLEATIGDIFQEKELEELTYMSSQIDNWEDRFNSLHQSARDILAPYIEALVGDNFATEEERLKKVSELTTLINANPSSLLFALSQDTVNSNLSNIANTNKILMTSSKELEDIIKEEIAKARKQKKKSSHLLAELDDLRQRVAKAPEVNAKFTTLSNNIKDMMKIAQARALFIQKFNGYRKNPKALREYLAAQEAELAQESEVKATEELKGKLSEVANTVEFDEVLSTEPNIALRDKVVDDLIKDGNQLAINYKDEFDYDTNIDSEINKIQQEGLKQDARVVYSAFKKSNPGIDNIANPDLLFVTTKEELGLNGMTDNSFILAKNELLNALYTINNSVLYNSRFDQEYRKIPTKININKVQAEPVIEADNTVVGGQTEADVTKDNSDIERSQERINNDILEDATVADRRLYYRPAISQTYKPDNKISDKLGGQPRFDRIVKYLNSKDAFDYVDSGKLKEGDEIRFMIDPSVDEETVFMVKTNMAKPWQVVGSLNESNMVLNSTPGLRTLITNVREAFQRTDKIEPMVYGPSVKVSKMMIGKVIYDNQERALQNIANTESPIFGIVRNGILSTNGKISNTDIELSAPLLEREGHVYLLTKTIKNKYRPIALRTTIFNKENILRLVDSPIYKHNIKPSIERLATVTTDEELQQAKEILGRDLYVGSMEFSLTTKDGNLAIRFKDKENRHNNKIVSLSNTNGALVEIGDDESLSSIENTKTVDEISTEITIALASFNLPIQIDIQKINSGGYNTYLRNSDVLFSNTANAKIIDNWFITEYFDEDGVAKSAIPPVAVKEEVKQVTRPIQEGSNSGVRVDDNTIVSNGDIINDKGEDITDNKTPEEYNKIEETAEEILRKPLDPNNEANKHAVSSLDVMRRVVKRPIVKSKPTKSVSLPTLGEQTKSVNQLEKPNKTFNFEDLDSELRTILSLNELDIERDAVIGKEFNRKEFNNLPIEEKVKIIYQARNSVLELRNVYESEFGKGMKMTSEFISKNLPELSERHKKMWEKLSQTEKQHEIKCLGY